MCWFSQESEAFNLYTTQFVKKTVIVPYVEVFLIDSWDLNKQDKQNKFLWQAVSLTRELVPVEFSSELNCLRIRGNCSNWVILTDTLPGNVNPFE